MDPNKFLITQLAYFELALGHEICQITHSLITGDISEGVVDSLVSIVTFDTIIGVITTKSC